ncbi:GATA transcription factor 3-like [Nymphaea colorata]|nr:GATA transcription factor 3-like [Nymphaea colorata]
MGFPQEMPFSGDTLPGGAFNDFLSDERNFSGEAGIEWLSAFVEDCFSGGGSGHNPGATQVGSMVDVAASSTIDARKPVKPRTKRRRQTGTPSGWSNEDEEEEEEEEGEERQEEEQEWDKGMEGYDPPLLDQAYWLADSELIVQKKIKEVEDSHIEEGSKAEDNGSASPTPSAAAAAAAGGGSNDSLEGSNGQQQQQQPRRCSHCLAQRTPQWRAGPLGPKTLCNACGVRFKSGRLLPEYRPAKSPTFVSYKHSNSHKKVMEMRMSMSVASD